MTYLRANRMVGVRVWSEGPLDSRGSPTNVWAAAADRAVYGWAPAGTAEPFDVGRDAVAWDLDLLVPPEFSVSRLDRIVVDGDEYTVEGRSQSYDHGPFDFKPGGVVRLRRVEG